MDNPPTDIDSYLTALPDDARATLAEIRRLILAMAPDAVESISYGLPTFKYKGRALMYFGAAKQHCAIYGTSKGTLRFPLGEPPPEEFVHVLVQEQIAKIESKLAGSKRGKPGNKTTG